MDWPCAFMPIQSDESGSAVIIGTAKNVWSLARNCILKIKLTCTFIICIMKVLT